MTKNLARLVACAVALSLAGCAKYVKQENYDATIADLRAKDQQLQSQIDTLQSRVDALATEMQKKFAIIEKLQGRLRVEMPAHFAFDEATLREQDKPRLDDFARVIREHHPDVLVTVEGFADPAGSAAYNKKLGQRRADAVRDYLVSNGGLSGDKVRTVSYGESRDRQVNVGACCENGLENRRVALVIDYAPGS